jgi:hypothetical protein
MASARRIASSALSGPTETITTSPSPVASFSLRPSSTALASNGFSTPSPERSSRFVDGSIRRAAVASGTYLAQTAIFMPRGTLPRSARRNAARFQGAMVVPRQGRRERS